MLDAESGRDSITDVGISDGVIQSLETDIDPNNADNLYVSLGNYGNSDSNYGGNFGAAAE